MSEPHDIRQTAVSVYSRYLKDIGSLSLVDLLAEALMAERERSAKVADDMCGNYVADAIRRGTPHA